MRTREARGSLISNLQLVLILTEHSFEPLCVDGCFDPHTSRTRKGSVEPLLFARLVFQVALDDLALGGGANMAIR
jgi:hypothetical protein